MTERPSGTVSNTGRALSANEASCYEEYREGEASWLHASESTSSDLSSVGSGECSTGARSCCRSAPRQAIGELPGDIDLLAWWSGSLLWRLWSWR